MTYYRGRYGAQYAAEHEGRYVIVDSHGNLTQSGNATLRFCRDLTRVRMKYVPIDLLPKLRAHLKTNHEHQN
ncbi:hypothetical protein [Microcystis phage Mvi-JY20]|uniref:Uncharacterized protein n=1 Tax=Microcystis phage Mvi-JY20 TaxID=3128146 RepID=A0AAX4QIA9_9CAUD